MEIAFYDDKLVTVSDSGFRLKNYYLPFVAKFVRYENIQTIKQKKADLVNGRWRIWGSGTLTIWFPLDWERPSRKVIYHMELCNQKVRVGFTVENDQIFTQVMETKGIHINHN